MTTDPQSVQKPALASQDDAALEECAAVKNSIKAKADKYKKYSRAAVIFLTTTTAAIPVFIGLSGDNFAFGKLVPSILAASAAVVSALVELEKPHGRWALYRRYQRALEGLIVKYRFRVDPYDGSDRGVRLAGSVAQLQIDLHDEWTGLQPSASEISSTSSDRGEK
ncbi:DUF4231 domain-containing protein [Winogradskya humida]|uniref:DUF4231 domain-containing protein n=1 Tax=Winogradskya humida TaxID=113566 RepID=A0ABQ3ZNW8_9ACTN|nr:DUF4231 domain-containing protein [Actinoplanes humidus]GIE20283.1 hypothetical protein Ahu01nite_033850 [Actinoplanes humidus]